MDIVTEKIEKITSMVRTGKTPPSKNQDYYNGDINWYGPSDLDKTSFLGTSQRTITQKAVSEKKANLIPGNSILLGCIGDIGKIGMIKTSATSNQQITAIKPNDKVDYRYLFYWLKANKNLLRANASNAVLPILNNKSLLSIKVSYPKSLQDQKRIAQVLTNCEELIAKRKESIALLDELLKSTFLEMFWKKNSDYQNWKINSIEDYALKKKGSMRSGPFGSSLLHEEFSESGDVKVLGIDNVVNNLFEEGKPRYITYNKYEGLKRYTVYPGDVLISIMATNGRSAVVPENIPLAINSKHLAAITLNQEKILPTYLKYSFQHHPVILRQLSKRVKGAIMSGLNLTIIKKLKLPKPPLSLQEKFALIVEKILETKKIYQNHLLELENLYGRLSQDAFKGELDLSKVVLREEFLSEDETLKNSKVELPVASDEGEPKKKRLTKKEIKQLESNLKKKKRKKDITHLSLPDFLGVPEEIQSTREKVEFDLGLDNLFFQFTLKDTFKKGQAFTFEEIENRLHDYFYYTGDMDFPYEQFKNAIFDFLDNQPPLVEQFFDDNDAQIKLRLTDEAFKA